MDFEGGGSKIEWIELQRQELAEDGRHWPRTALRALTLIGWAGCGSRRPVWVNSRSPQWLASHGSWLQKTTAQDAQERPPLSPRWNERRLRPNRCGGKSLWQSFLKSKRTSEPSLIGKMSHLGVTSQEKPQKLVAAGLATRNLCSWSKQHTNLKTEPKLSHGWFCRWPQLMRCEMPRQF